MKTKILLIEDDAALREATTAFLESEGFQVTTAGNGQAGLERALQGKAALIVMDLMLPEVSGIEICRSLREKGIASPIIMVTGRKIEESDKVIGLEIGADDYLLKPFGQRELLARIHAVLRRSHPTPSPVPGERMVFGDVTIDFKKRTAVKGKTRLSLTAREYDLLRFLAAHEGEVITRETLLSEVWGYDKFPTTRTIDTFVHNLRNKLEKDPARPAHLITVPWTGYKFQK